MAHDEIRDQYDEVQAEGLYEEGMARMALYHRHCQDPVIFRALGDVGSKSLLDLACGDAGLVPFSVVAVADITRTPSAMADVVIDHAPAPLAAV